MHIGNAAAIHNGLFRRIEAQAYQKLEDRDVGFASCGLGTYLVGDVTVWRRSRA